jgi:hypothetical protein
MSFDQLPRRFRLVRENGDVKRPVGYGLGLPGGSAICVSWPPGSGITFHSAASADRCAFILDGDVEWIDEENVRAG